MKAIQDLIRKSFGKHPLGVESAAAMNPFKRTRVGLLSLSQRSRPPLKQAITDLSRGLDVHVFRLTRLDRAFAGTLGSQGSPFIQGWKSLKTETEQRFFQTGDSSSSEKKAHPLTTHHDQKNCSRSFMGRLPVSFPSLCDSAASLLFITELVVASLN